jgi:hypothetical protein
MELITDQIEKLKNSVARTMSDALRVALARCALDAEGAPMSAWSDLLNATTSALSDEESLATSTVDMAQLLALVERAAKRDDVDDAVDSLVDTAIDTISSTSSTSTSTSISSTTSSTSSTSIDALSPTVCAAYQQHVVLDDSSTLLTSEMRRSISQTQLAVSTNSAELAAWWFAVDSQRSALAVALVLTCWNVAPRQRRRAPVERLVDCAVGDATTSPLPALLLAVVLDHSATDIEMLGLCHGALPLVLTRLRECARLPLRPARVVLQMCCRLARVSVMFMQQLDDANGHQLLVEQCLIRAAPHSDEQAFAAMVLALLAASVPRDDAHAVCALKFLDALLASVPSMGDMLTAQRTVDALDVASGVAPALLLSLRTPFVGILGMPQSAVAPMLRSLLNLVERHLASSGALSRGELQLLCALCTIDRPCCAVWISRFAAEQITARRIAPVAFRDANLVALLSSAIDTGVVSATVRAEPADLAAARAYLDREQGDIAGDNDAEVVRVAVVAAALDALLLVTRDSLRSLSDLPESLGVLSAALTQTTWRRRILPLFQRLAAPELQCETRLIAELVLKLQSTGGIATIASATLGYRMDLLDALQRVFESGSSAAQEQFRRHGGLAWLASALAGLASAYQHAATISNSSSTSTEVDAPAASSDIDVPVPPVALTPQLKDQLIVYACALLHAVAGAVRGHSANALYLHRDIRLETLLDPLALLGIGSDRQVRMVCDALFALAVRGMWPARCEAHEARADRPLLDVVMCAKCVACVRVRDGAVLCHIFRLFAHSASQVVLSAVVSRVDQLAAAHVDNAAALGDADLLRLLLHTFNDVLSAPDPSATVDYSDLDSRSDAMVPVDALERDGEWSGDGCEPADELQTQRVLRTRLFCLILRVAPFAGRPAEVRALLGMLREPLHSPQLLRCLAGLFSLPTAPAVSVRFGDEDCARGFESERTAKLSWPPAAGYCVSFWMCVHDFGARSTTLISIEPIKASATAATLATTLTLEPDGRIAVFALDAVHVFDFHVTLGTWQLVSLVHSAPTAAHGDTLAQLFVDGNFVGRAAVPLPPSSNAPLILRLGDCNSDVSPGAPIWSVGAAFVFGDEFDMYPRIDDNAMSDRLVESLGWIDDSDASALADGAAAVTSSVVSRRDKTGGGGGNMAAPQLRLLRALGADYAGDFRLDAQRLPAVRAHGDRGAVSIERAAVICWHLRASLMVAFSPRQGGVAAQRVRVPSGLAGGGAGLLAPFAVQPQPSQSRLRSQQRAVAREQLESIGGVGVLVMAAVSAADDVRRVGALRALRVAIQGVDGARQLRSFEALRGYELLAHFAEVDRWPLVPQLVGELFEFAGISSTPDNDGLLTVGVLTSDAALRHLLLNWSLWRLAPHDALVRVLRSLAGLVSPLHRHRNANVRMLRTAHAPTALLFALQSSEPPSAAAGRYVQLLLRRLTIDPVASGDVPHLVAKFLVATQPENAAAAEPRVPSADDAAARSGARPHLRHCMLALLVDMQIEFDDAGGDHSLMSVVDFRTTLGLLRYASLPFQMTLLRLIGLLLRRYEAAATFQSDDCYALMAAVLRDTNAPLCLFRELFDIMIGRRRADDGAMDVSGTTWYARNSFAATTSASSDLFGERLESLARPEVVLTIMRLLAARDVVALHCRISVLKALYSVFLQCDKIKLQLLEADFALLLSEVIDTETRLLLERESNQPQAVATSDESGEADAESSDMSGAPLDVALQVARTTVVFGCEAHGDARLLVALFDSLHVIGQQPNRVTEQLQLRVAADALQFYRDNAACASSGSLAVAFGAIIDEVCSFVCWQPTVDSSAAFSITSSTVSPASSPAKTSESPLVSAVRNFPFGTRRAWRRNVSARRTAPPTMARSMGDADDGVTDPAAASDDNSDDPVADDNVVRNLSTSTLIDMAAPGDAVLSPRSEESADERELPTTRTRGDVAQLLIDTLTELSLERADCDRALSRTLTFACEQRHDERLFLNALRTLATPVLAAKRVVTRLLQQRAFIVDVLALTAEPVAAYAKARASSPAGAAPESGVDRIGALADAMWRTIERLHEAKPGDGTFTELAKQRASPFAGGGGGLRASVRNDAAGQAAQRDVQRDKWRAKRRAQLTTFATAAMARTARQREATRRLIAKANAFRQVQLRPFQRRALLILSRQMSLVRHWETVRVGLTHERAVFADRVASVRWQLDPTEGFNRCRIRLMRIERERMPFFLDERLVMPLTTDIESEDTNEDGRHLMLDEHDLSSSSLAASSSSTSVSLASSSAVSIPATPSTAAVPLSPPQTPTAASAASGAIAAAATPSAMSRVLPGDRIELNVPCELVTINAVRSGEFLLGAHNAYFVDVQLLQDEGEHGGRLSPHSHVTWPYAGIRELHRRRRLLRDTALEIFLIGGRTHLVGFATRALRDSVYDRLVAGNRLPARVDYEAKVAGGLLRDSITTLWQRGELSNFAYLMHLNTLAGRTFNDLTQYPVFPFVLSEGSGSDELDLSRPELFRDLSKPMGAQDPERLARFVDRYQQLCEMEGETPYHYGSHYSNSGSVLHFLVRIEPFSTQFVEFQGGRFDVPDRAFHRVATTWRLSAATSSSDVKELIPEFFYLPEFLVNSNRYDLGVKQSGERVDDVELPPWARGDARRFVRMHRDALESAHVSAHLHEWIDLIFGVKQRGPQALAALNLFHPLTYEGAVDVDAIDDPVIRTATIAQISSYGQTPKQLFTKPHVRRKPREPLATAANAPDRLACFRCGRWRAPSATLCCGRTRRRRLSASIGLLLQPALAQFVSWNNWDRQVRVCALDSKQVRLTASLLDADDVLCAASASRGGVDTGERSFFITGGTACVVRAWRCVPDADDSVVDARTVASGDPADVAAAAAGDASGDVGGVAGGVAVGGASSSSAGSVVGGSGGDDRARFLRLGAASAPSLAVAAASVASRASNARGCGGCRGSDRFAIRWRADANVTHGRVARRAGGGQHGARRTRRHAVWPRGACDGAAHVERVVADRIGRQRWHGDCVGPQSTRLRAHAAAVGAWRGGGAGHQPTARRHLQRDSRDERATSIVQRGAAFWHQRHAGGVGARRRPSDLRRRERSRSGDWQRCGSGHGRRFGVFVRRRVAGGAATTAQRAKGARHRSGGGCGRDGDRGGRQ